MTDKPATSEKRKQQLRDSQRRRREVLAAGTRRQVNIYLTNEAISALNGQCNISGVDRHDLLNNLILQTFK
jgi:hypothetical protein